MENSGLICGFISRKAGEKTSNWLLSLWCLWDDSVLAVKKKSPEAVSQPSKTTCIRKIQKSTLTYIFHAWGNRSIALLGGKVYSVHLVLTEQIKLLSRNIVNLRCKTLILTTGMTVVIEGQATSFVHENKQTNIKKKKNYKYMQFVNNIYTKTKNQPTKRPARMLNYGHCHQLKNMYWAMCSCKVLSSH